MALTGTAGAVQKRYTYDAFGNEASPSSSDGNPFRYCGEFFDKETGSYYLRARYYDPTIGRFTQQDTYKGDYKDPLSLNLYTYCANNPILYVDPSGHDLEKLLNTVKTATSLLIHAGEAVASKLFHIDTAEIGAYWLNMYQDSNGIYHANFDCWQAYFGYNDAYDFFFDIGTSMEREKFPFVSGGQEYILWVWKGDYVNLGAGAELGIYRNFKIGSLDTPHWDVDKEEAMMMTLALEYKGKTIINWAPDDKQWWITGFNPAYKFIWAGNLTAIYTVTFNSEAMYYDFYQKYGQGKDIDPRWTFFPRTKAARFRF